MLGQRSTPEIVERIFADGEGDGGDASAVLSRTFERLQVGISPVLGDAGYRAMFTRCVRKVKAAHPTLGAVVFTDSEPFHEPLITRMQRMERKDSAEVRAVGRALLTQFIELLQTLIGDELTSTIIHRTWPDVLSSAVDPPEKI